MQLRVAKSGRFTVTRRPFFCPKRTLVGLIAQSAAAKALGRRGDGSRGGATPGPCRLREASDDTAFDLTACLLDPAAPVDCCSGARCSRAVARSGGTGTTEHA